MSTSLTALLLAAAPAVSRVLPGRPRLLVIPLAVSVLCVLWIALLRAALPGFRPRHTRIAIGLSVTMVAAILLRFMLRSVAGAMGGSWFYLLVILPTAVLQVTVIASLMSAPFWVPLGLWAKRRLQRLPQVVPSPPQSTALGRPLPRALQRPVQVLRRIGVLPAPGAAPRITRREVLLAAPWVVPAGAFVGSLYGVGYESRHVVLRQVKIRIPGLPPALAGLRIGQVTDIHIARLQTQMRQLERALQLLADARVDLLCPTGDLCDEPRVHLDVLRLIQSMPTRLGHFACLGNHELYLGDLDWVRRCYDRAKI
ncbi:MAG TPA: metallophosphoesterase, partial [Pseudomonadota bacterium]|nr:metallophosphoesterase [Pseudomonadota bacterium]